MKNNLNDTALLLEDRSISTKELVNTIRKTSQMPALIRELIIDIAVGEVALEESQEAKSIKEFREQNKLESEEAFSKFLISKNLDYTLFLQILTRPHKVIRYREDRWGPCVNSIYLKHKEKYDLITYRRLESKSTDVMQEVYFRLKDKEDSWVNLAKQFPGAPIGARMDRVPTMQLEPTLNAALRNAGPGSIIRPLELNNQLVIVAELESIQASKLDESLRTIILQNEFDTWLAEECTKIMSKLEFPE